MEGIAGLGLSGAAINLDSLDIGDGRTVSVRGCPGVDRYAGRSLGSSDGRLGRPTGQRGDLLGQIGVQIRAGGGLGRYRLMEASTFRFLLGGTRGVAALAVMSRGSHGARAPRVQMG